MSKTKTIVIHHSADWDGIFCREIAKKFMPDAELIGWDYGEPEPAKHLDGSQQLYILDLSVPSLMDYPKLVWIDHHRSAIEKYPSSIPGYRIDGVAACRLAWQLFQDLHDVGMTNEKLLSKKDAYIERRVTEPWAVRLVGEYDVWDKRDSDAELFQHGLASEELYSAAWDNMLNAESHGSSTVVRLLNQGRALQYVREKEYANVILKQGFTIYFEGLNFLACNSHRLDIRSQLFKAGIRSEHDALLGFTFMGDHWSISMYHAPGREDIDLSKIAVKYGGGGHKGACGMRMKTLPWIP